MVLGCGPGSAAPPDGGPPLALDVQNPPGAQIGLHYGKSVELRVRYHTDDPAAQAVAGQTVRFSIFGDPAGSTLARDQSKTDASGTATVTLTGGQAEASFRVAATAVNAAEADFDVSISKLDFVELDVQLSWPAPTSSTTLRALLYDDRSCVDLPAAVTLPAPFRALSKPNATFATLQFLNLLSKRYAVVGRAENAMGNLVGYGCVDLGAELVPPGSTSTLPLPLAAALASPAGGYTLTSTLMPAPSLAQLLIGRWQLYGHCQYGAAQTLLDAMSITTGRDPPKSDGCRPSSSTSLDVQLQDLLTAPPTAPARQLDALVDDLSAVTTAAKLTSHLTVRPAGAQAWSSEHALASITFSTVGGGKGYDLIAFGMPVIDVKDVPTSYDGTTLTLGKHGLTLGWTSLWKQAFVDLGLAVRFPTLGTPPVHALVAAVVQAAARNGKSGCAAVEDLVCSVIGGTPCNQQAACLAAIDQVAAALDAPFAPTSGIDLALAGSATAVDATGDLIVDRLDAGSWMAPGLQTSSFSGTRP